MSPERRKQLLLALLVVLLVGFGGRLLRQLGASGSGGSAGSAAASAGGLSRRTPLSEVIDLRLQDLQADAGRYRPGRDPFRYGEARRPPLPPPDPGIAEAARRAVEAAPSQAVTLPPPAAQPPPIDVVYLGSFGPRDGRLAVFSDGQEIFNVFEGDALKGKFIVESLGYESVDLRFIGFPDAPPQRLGVGE